MFCSCFNKSEAAVSRVSGQSRLGLGFGARSGLVLGLGATRQLPPRKIARRLGLGFGLGLVLGLGGGGGGARPGILVN